MIVEWPVALIAIAFIAAAAWLARPYVVGRSTEQARAAALADITQRLDRVEANLIQGTRKMPGRIG